MIEANKGYNIDCLELLKRIPDESLHIICIDPPYLYLKNQKLERAFAERIFFSECKRVLKKNGFLVMFGRGSSFYRWNNLCSELGFTFKEEIVWDKSYSSSPLMALSRVHETIAIYCKGNAGINRVKVPYLEMKGHDIPAIVSDIKRLKTTFKNTNSLNAVIKYLEDNFIEPTGRKTLSTGISSEINQSDRCLNVVKAIKDGMNEKSIIRSDFYDSDKFTKYGATSDKRKDGDRCVKVINSIAAGMNEKTIIKQGRDHYNTIHPTQKPVRLLERLIALVLPKTDEPIIAADFFAGSFSFAEACINMGINWVCCEIDKEYYDLGMGRIQSINNTLKQRLFT